MARGEALVWRRQAEGWLRERFDFQRNVYLLLFYTLGKGFQISIGAVTTNLYALSLGYNLQFIGLLTGAPALGSLLAAVPVGFLADRFGRKPPLIISALITPLTLVAIGLSTSAPLLLVAGFVNGMGATAYWVTGVPVLLESSREDQQVWVLSLNNFLLLGLGALGGLIGGAVPEAVAGLLHLSASSTIPLRWGVLAAAIAAGLPALPLIFLRETAAPEKPAPERALVTVEDGQLAVAAALPSHAGAALEDASDDDIALAAVATPRARVILFIKLLVPDALSSTGAGAVLGLLQVFYVLRFGMVVGVLGVVFAAAGVLGGVSSLMAAAVERRWGRLRTATGIQFLSLPVVLLIGFAPVFALAVVGQFVNNLLSGIFMPVYQAFAMDQVPSRLRGTLNGFYSVTWSIGFSVGPAIAGWMQVRMGLSSSFVLSAVCIGSAGLLLRLFFGQRAKPRAAPSLV